MRKTHPDLEPDSFKNKVDLGAYVEHFKLEIIDRGRDTLDTFIREGIHIKYDNPPLNNMNTNGFIFVWIYSLIFHLYEGVTPGFHEVLS